MSIPGADFAPWSKDFFSVVVRYARPSADRARPFVVLRLSNSLVTRASGGSYPRRDGERGLWRESTTAEVLDTALADKHDEERRALVKHVRRVHTWATLASIVEACGV